MKLSLNNKLISYLAKLILFQNKLFKFIVIFNFKN
jgi:hypothetical protein